MIRSVKPEDAAAIATIYNHYVLETTISFEVEPLSEEEMRARIGHTSAEFPFLVWEAEGRVLGYACAHCWKERAAYAGTWEVSIYLHPQSCGQGIGSRLMERLIADCRRGGCRSLIACITGDNETSRAFHRRHGFCRVSHFSRVGMKFGRILDVVDYQLEL